MTVLQRWRFASRLAVRDLRRHRLSALLSVMAMAIPASAVVAVAVVAPNMIPVSGDGTGYGSEWVGAMIAAVSQFAPLVLILVGAMVGAAMIVSVRRSERMLARLAAIGAPPRVLARVMSARGLILGVLAVATSVVVGIAAGIAILVGSGSDFVAVDVAAIAVVAIATIGLSWSTSLVAAGRASGIEKSMVLRDARRPARSMSRRARVGLTISASGLSALLIVGALGFVGRALPEGLPATLLRTLSGQLAAPAALTVLIGAALAFPALVRWAARGPARLPGAAGLAARIAARDAERSGARSGAAAASIMLVTFTVGGYLTFFASSDAWSVADHDWQLQRDQVAADLVMPTRWNPIERDIVGDPDAVAAAMSDGVDATEVRVLSGVLGPYWGSPVDDLEGYSGRQTMVFPPEGLPLPQSANEGICGLPFEESGLSDKLCTPGSLDRFELAPTKPAIWVGDAADLALILGAVPDVDILTALKEGTALALQPRYLAADGTVTIQWWGANQFVPEDEPNEFLPAGTPRHSVRLDGIAVPMEHQIGYGLFLSPAAAESMGLAAVPVRALAQAPSGLTYEKVGSVDLSVFPGDLWLEAEMGPSTGDRSWYRGAVLLAAGLVGAIAITSIGLSRIEGRRLERTMTVLGAARTLRRGINGWYALFIVGIGSLAGTLCGTLVVFGYSFALPSPPALPYAELAIIGLGVPLFIALIAALLPVPSPANHRGSR